MSMLAFNLVTFVVAVTPESSRSELPRGRRLLTRWTTGPLCSCPPAHAAIDRGAFRREVDRLVVLVPAHAIALVSSATEDLDHLAATRRSATDLVHCDPVAGPNTTPNVNRLRGHDRIESPSARRSIGRPPYVRSVVARAPRP